MKALTKPGLILAFVLFGLPSYGSNLPVTLSTDVSNQINVTQLTNRLEEIKAMDKSSLTANEKRALRKELKAMKSALPAPTPDGNGRGGGVYLSLGAIIIIILLLIILL